MNIGLKSKGIMGGVTAIALFVSAQFCAAQEVKVPYVKETAVQARLAHALTEGSPYDIGAKRFAELVDVYTRGEVSFKIFPNAQLGLEQATAKDTQLGLLEGALVAINNATQWYPPLDVTLLPFIFRDREHVNSVIYGEIGEDLLEGYREASGMRIVSILEWGDRGIMNKVRPINSVEDLSGIKLRLPKNSTMIDTYSALGANPTAIDWGELYSALQQGVADGLEGPPQGMIDMKFTDFLDYYSYVPVFHGLAVILVNDAWFQSLSEENQLAVLRAGREAGEYQRWVSAKSHVDGLAKLADLGVEVNVIEDVEPFIEATKKIYESNRDRIGAEWIERVQNAGLEE